MRAVCDLPTPTYPHILRSEPGVGVPFSHSKSRQEGKCSQRGQYRCQETREQVTAQLSPGTAVGGGSTWQPRHRVSSVLGPMGCSAPGWFCLPGQRQLLLQENPGAFDLRLRVSLSHLDRGVQAWLPGDLPTLPHEELGSSNPPFFSYSAPALKS